MSKDCCEVPNSTSEKSKKQKLVLWIALVINATMFFIEIGSSFVADSLSLKADAIDFLGDSVNYGVSLFVLGMSLQVRAKASILKASSMGLFGAWVIGEAIYHIVVVSSPQPETMGLVGFLAFLANLFVAFLLYQFRDGDSNMQSVWLCTRNDVIGNLAVIIAAGSVYMFSSRWPDLLIAFAMGALALQSAYLVFKQAKLELTSSKL